MRKMLLFLMVMAVNSFSCSLATIQNRENGRTVSSLTSVDFLGFSAVKSNTVSQPYFECMAQKGYDIDDAENINERKKDSLFNQAHQACLRRETNYDRLVDFYPYYSYYLYYPYYSDYNSYRKKKVIVRLNK